ncbi:ketopantoate reductase family protein [Pseudonocardia humida]|uniref:Ketopantoate reductase family protein n=1 Tax=Pseudonocardia humida TaxID=2800819 RepID=A0ABT0ZWJ8_9PSEU|nr:2-dehydropantoate 2-reductase N-terminal domain-containing protein [Pseudonocardia humida]MCO1655034.1 ketopantoate reductase family protein [Pseudonocardia humida]
MRYVVIGAGAIGGVVAARLHEAGREVLAVARGAHLAAIREHGLRLDEPDGSRTVALAVAGTVAEVDWRADDVVLLCTKSQDSEALLDELRAAAPDVAVACVQNGVANERTAARRFERVQGVYVMVPAEHLEPGRVAGFSAPVAGVLDVGRYPSGADELSTRIADDLTAAGYSSRAVEAVMPWKYAKLLVNLGNAADAACGPDDPDLPELTERARVEGERCLDAAGIGFAGPAEVRERRSGNVSVRPVGGRDRPGGSSTWQSLRRGSGSVEAEHLNGEIVALGRAHGVRTPVNEVLLRTVVAMARDGVPPGSRTARELLVEAGG